MGMVHGTSSIPVLGDAVQGIAGGLAGGVCSSSLDGLHHTSAISDDKVYEDSTGYFSFGTCTYCGDRFKVYGGDLETAYETQVADLPATGVTSSGTLLFNPLEYFCELVLVPAGWLDPSELPYSYQGDDRGYFVSLVTDPLLHVNYECYSSDVDSFSSDLTVMSICPISGIYSFVEPARLDYYYVQGDGTYIYYDTLTADDHGYNMYDYLEQSRSFSAGQYFRNVVISASNNPSKDLIDSVIYFVCDYYPPLYEITPFDSSLVTNTYTINSRPTSITGDYGIIGDNGQITKVDTTTIVNETNNTYTNPSTGTTSTITDWTYDYSDRSYDLTLEGGDTVTVTYGDENVTIQEGDTVYNVYYIVEGTGGDPGVQPTPTPGPETCQHSYTSTVDREATCTVPGQMTYTCSLCGHSYTEAIPAKGHTWTVLQTVTTEYDQEGNLLQQGYTIYQCSVCGEQYKDETGTGPPGSGDSSGEEGETIWDKLGNLIGSVFDGLLGVVEAVIGKILDALIALVEMISEKLEQVVTLVLGFFDYIPGLFVGFLGFLTAVFVYIPEDIMLLLTFGIAVVVFIGIIKALRR